MQTFAKILVVDNDPSVGGDLIEMLTPLGYEVHRAIGNGEALISNALALGASLRSHVAIIDLRLFDDYVDEVSGISLLEPLSSAKCILYSSHLTATITREARKHGAYEWINKADDPDLLIQIIDEAATQMSARKKALKILWPTSWEIPTVLSQLFAKSNEHSKRSNNHGQIIERDVLDDVLHQLFPQQQVLHPSTLSGAIITITATSRARSFVMKVVPDQLEPQVVKLAKAADIETEVANYHEFIENRLGGHFHTRLERSIRFWDIGAALYSFLGTPLDTIRTFSTFYRTEQDSQAILAPLHHFFQEVWQRHYTNWRQLPEGITLFAHYDRQFHLTTKLQRDADPALYRAFAHIEPPLPDPIEWLRRHRDQSLVHGAKEVIVHGDLHGDNLFVSEQHAWVIDFERAGYHHALCDFAELEIDILTRLVCSDETDTTHFAQEFVNLLRVLYERPLLYGSLSQDREDELFRTLHPPLRKAATVIVGVRHLAQQTVGYRDGQEYLWALLFDAIFASYMEHAKPQQRICAFLVAATICEKLGGKTNVHRS